jgi:hypothetical protein
VKDIIFIPSYTPTKEKQSLLRNLVHGLKNKGYKVAVCTHSITPNDIINECDYFFYDKENKITYDPNIQYWYQYSINSSTKFHFKLYNIMATHIVPIIKMVYPSLQYLKSLGYKKVHLMEYDSKILDYSVFKQNSLLLDEFDIISYYYDDSFPVNKSNINSFFFGCFKSMNISNLDFSSLFLTENQLVDLYREYFNNKKWPCTEKIIYDKLSPNKKICWLPLKTLAPNILLDQSESTPYSEGKEFTIHNHHNYFHFFGINKSNKDEYFTIIINDKSFEFIIPYKLNKWKWRWIKLTEYNENSVIKIYKNNKFIIKIDMKDPKEKEWITKWSKIKFS